VSPAEELLKKPGKQVPRRLKPARDDKHKELAATQLKQRSFKACRTRLF